MKVLLTHEEAFRYLGRGFLVDNHMTGEFKLEANFMVRDNKLSVELIVEPVVKPDAPPIP